MKSGNAMRLSHLLDRNVLWAQRKTEEDPTFFMRMAEQQTPRYMWLGCSDSRVTANDVLNLDPGEVFVHRNIANVVHTSDMNFLAVLEFAVEVLKVQDIIVCGHYGCGGVHRALEEGRSALVDHWLQPLVMYYRKNHAAFATLPHSRARHERMVEVNVEMQMRRIAQTPIVEAAWARGQTLHLHGWVYGVHDGLLRSLCPSISSLAARDALQSLDERASHPFEPQSAIRLHALDAFASGCESNG
jgi:carbonic anhydrase